MKIMTLTCEYCGKENEEYLQIIFEKWACQKCYKKGKYVEIRIEKSNEHRLGCTCHACCFLGEFGFKRDKNNKWIKL